MNRYIPIAALALLASCASGAKPTAVQGAYGLEQGYTIAARAEAIVLPAMTPADQAAVRHLDAQAYAEVVKLRAAAETGSVSDTEIQATADALSALMASLNKGG